MPTPEGKIESYLVSQCKKRGILSYKFVSPANAGVPDRILIGNGITMFVELKAPGKKPRELQVKVISQMLEHGADVRVADSKQMIDDIINEILSQKSVDTLTQQCYTNIITTDKKLSINGDVEVSPTKR